MVLEVLEANVKRGSPCYEKGHTGGCAVECSHACTEDTSGGWVQAVQSAPQSCRGWARSAQGAMLVLALPAACMLRASNVHALPWSNCCVVLLTWCESPRDIAQLTRILSQLCAANRKDNGGVVVVLAQHVRGGTG